jgi:hypothetical protein
MNRKHLMSVSAVVLSLASAQMAAAACRVESKAAAANVVAVPVAVSLGVPVAEVAPYYYSYQAVAPQSAERVASDAAIEEIAARVAEKLRSPSAGGLAAAGPASAPHSNEPPHLNDPPLGRLPGGSLVAEKCARCHSGSEPKAGLSLENLAALNCETRLKAVRAVLSEKMPKGGPPLTAEEAGKVLEELVGER